MTEAEERVAAVSDRDAGGIGTLFVKLGDSGSWQFLWR